MASPAKRHTIAGIIILILITAGLTGCMNMGKEIPSGKTILAEKLEKAAREYADFQEKNPGKTDDTFSYTPGVVRKTEPAEIVIDHETGLYCAENELIVTLKEGATEGEFLDQAAGKGLRCEIVGQVPVFRMLQVRVAEWTGEIISVIGALEAVQSVQRNFIQETLAGNSTAKAGWTIKDYGIDRIWEVAQGQGVTIAVVDSGMDIDCPQMKGRITDPYSVVTGSAAFEDHEYTRGGDIVRVIEHGTKVSSIAAAADTQGTGAVGVAPQVRVMPIQVFGYSVFEEKLAANDLMVIEGIARAIEFKADIINLSLGTDYSRILPKNGVYSLTSGEQKQLFKSLENIVKPCSSLYRPVFIQCNQRDIIVICSAGNDGIPAHLQPIAQTHFPIVVGSIDRDGKVSGYSNYGSNVACYAPGEEVPSVGPGGNLFTVSGTSFSAPYVSGVIALAMSSGLSSEWQDLFYALKKSNFEGRFSILDVKSASLFSPISFFDALGGSVHDGRPQVERMRRFAAKYGSCFISADDTDTVKLDKILRYYDIRRSINASNDPEVEYALRLTNTGDNFDYLLKQASRGDAYNTAFYAAMILAEKKLSNSQLKVVTDHLMDCDFIAIILKRNRYKAAIPGYYRRLTERAGDFNANTLHALQEMGETKAAGAVMEYLKKLQIRAETPWDEDTACQVLTYLGDPLSVQVRELVMCSFDRYRKEVEEKRYFDMKKYRTMGEALIRIGKKSGLLVILRGLEILDEQEATRVQNASEYDAWENNSGMDAEDDYREFQWLLNTYTEFGFKFDYQVSLETRTETINRFREKIKDTFFSRGMFR
ncbi:MAG: S8 family serine peptidase [Spirochaetales bacterium]|nr:S8 family serine peptidase [Spirochaetales bacterium]